MASIARWILIKFIRIYQNFLSGLLPSSCKFYPSCSSYALLSIKTHGIFWGLLYSVWRLLRCNSFSRGGYDPVKPRCK